MSLLMVKQHADGYFRSDRIQFPGIIHGFTTRLHGDMRTPDRRQLALSPFGITLASMWFPQQVHGQRIAVADRSGDGRTVGGVDGLVIGQPSSEAITGAGVFGADCIPVVLMAPHRGLAGVVHAGWRGILQGAIPELVRAVGNEGIAPEDMYVIIGPHIHVCCYSVPQERAVQVTTTVHAAAAQLREGHWYLDLTTAARLQLRDSGIPDDNIDADTPCTACNAKMFYSFRRDSSETFGEIMGFVLLRSTYG